MALISCISCGAKISDKAHACPKCGWTNQSEPPLANSEELQIEEDRKAEEQVGYDPGLERSRKKQKGGSINRTNRSLKFILLGIIFFPISILAINEMQYVGSPCNESCSVDCITYVWDKIGDIREIKRVERWGKRNRIEEYYQQNLSCSNEDGKGFQKAMLKLHQKYLNR